MDQQQVRSWYVDSRACEEQEDGSLTLDLYENVELTGHVCYIDDLSISGTTPNVAGNNMKCQAIKLGLGSSVSGVKGAYCARHANGDGLGKS